MIRIQESLISLLNKSLLVLFFPSVPSILLFAPLDGLRFFHCVLPKGTCKNTPRLVHAPFLHSTPVPRAAWQQAADAQRRPLPLGTPMLSGRQARLCVPATCSLTLFTLLLNTASACVNSLTRSLGPYCCATPSDFLHSSLYIMSRFLKEDQSYSCVLQFL